MADKRKPAKKRDPNRIYVVSKPGEDEAAGLARTVLRPALQAAVTLKEYGKAYGDLELAGLIEALSAQTKAATDGDLGRAEEMLTTQAHTLDAMFNHLAQRAINAEYIDHLDRYLKLALRAQSQSPATWEALATIKNPPVMGYVKQANIAHGHQQVNNAPGSGNGGGRLRARENPNLQDKLLEATDGERLDPRAARTPSRADPAMATVGEVDRAADRGR